MLLQISFLFQFFVCSIWLQATAADVVNEKAVSPVCVPVAMQQVYKAREFYWRKVTFTLSRLSYCDWACGARSAVSVGKIFTKMMIMAASVLFFRASKGQYHCCRWMLRCFKQLTIFKLSWCILPRLLPTVLLPALNKNICILFSYWVVIFSSFAAITMLPSYIVQHDCPAQLFLTVFDKLHNCLTVPVGFCIWNVPINCQEKAV
jgi:hypothetical protein